MVFIASQKKKIKSHAIEILGKVFDVDITISVQICSLLKTYLSDENENVKVTAIKVIGEIFSRYKDYYPSLKSMTSSLLDKMLNSRFISAEIEAIKVIGDLFSDLPIEQKNTAIVNIASIAHKASDNNILVTAIQFLNKVFNQPNDAISSIISIVIDNQITKLSDTAVRGEFIKLIGNKFNLIPANAKTKALSFLKQSLEISSNKEEIINIVESLGEIYKVISETTLKKEILDLMIGEKYLSHTDIDIRVAVIRVLGNISSQVPDKSTLMEVIPLINENILQAA